MSLNDASPTLSRCVASVNLASAHSSTRPYLLFSKIRCAGLIPDASGPNRQSPEAAARGSSALATIPGDARRIYRHEGRRGGPLSSMRKARNQPSNQRVAI